MKKLERHALAVLFTISIVAAESSVRVMTASVVVMIVHATAVVVDETMLVRCYTRWFCFRVRKRAVQSMGLGGFFCVDAKQKGPLCDLSVCLGWEPLNRRLGWRGKMLDIGGKRFCIASILRSCE